MYSDLTFTGVLDGRLFSNVSLQHQRDIIYTKYVAVTGVLILVRVRVRPYRTHDRTTYRWKLSISAFR